jgi:hypothetical protein
MGLIETYNCDACNAILSGRNKMATTAKDSYLSIKSGQITAEIYDKTTDEKSFAYLTSGQKLLTFCDGQCFNTWFTVKLEEAKKKAKNVSNHKTRDFYQEKFGTKQAY